MTQAEEFENPGPPNSPTSTPKVDEFRHEDFAGEDVADPWYDDGDGWTEAEPEENDG